jgi:hypothetical protein
MRVAPDIRVAVCSDYKQPHAKAASTIEIGANRHAHSLKPELRATPMSALRVVANLVIRLVSEPVRDLSVLLRLARQLLLDQKRLVGRLSGRKRKRR